MQLTDELARLFGTMGRMLTRHADKGMDQQDFSTLTSLANGACLDGTRLGDLAALQGFDTSTMSRRVAHLCEEELVDRHPDPQDGRAHLLSLSPRGRRALAAERTRRVQLIKGALSEWTPEDKGELTRLLGRLNDSLENA